MQISKKKMRSYFYIKSNFVSFKYFFLFSIDFVNFNRFEYFLLIGILSTGCFHIISFCWRSHNIYAIPDYEIKSYLLKLLYLLIKF